MTNEDLFSNSVSSHGGDWFDIKFNGKRIDINITPKDISSHIKEQLMKEPTIKIWADGFTILFLFKFGDLSWMIAPYRDTNSNRHVLEQIQDDDDGYQVRINHKYPMAIVKTSLSNKQSKTLYRVWKNQREINPSDEDYMEDVSFYSGMCFVDCLAEKSI